VPVTRGVAVVDIAGGRKSAKISLPTTPAAIWIVPSNGQLFAALYASGQVARVDSLSPGNKPELVAKIDKPVDVGGSQGGNIVYVISAAGPVIARLDALTGRLQGTTTPIAALAKATTPVSASGVSFSRAGRVVKATFRLSGPLAPRSLVKRDTRISDGQALVELWQGGITTTFPTAQGQGLALRVSAFVGRLKIAIGAKRNAFVRMSATLSGRTLVLSF